MKFLLAIIRRLFRSPRPSGLLTVEKFLYDAIALSSFYDLRYAITAARSALELALQSAVNRADCWPRNPHTNMRTGAVYMKKKSGAHIREFILALDRNGYLDEIQLGRLRRAAWAGNKAAHPKPCTQDREDLELMIAVVLEMQSFKPSTIVESPVV